MLAVTFCVLCSFTICPSIADGGANTEWTDLTGKEGFAAWKTPVGQWYRTREVGLKADNKRLLQGEPTGGPILVNGATGRTNHLVTKAKYRDVEFHCEFMIGEKSNSGVKFNGMYEIQLFDSYGKKAGELTGSDCGGIYPRGESLPRYHTIDNGSPPRVNASKPAGQWQELDIIFQAPRFDGQGMKVQNARFVKVVLNGQVIHESVELLYATGSAWRKVKEVAEGPILLQGDHGPVAFRGVRVRGWNGK
jgi:hypothetical protein